MRLSLKKEGLIVGLVLSVGLVLAGLGLRQDLDAENALTAKRLAHAFIPLLAKAHQAKDDLALQEDMMAFAQAPGVPVACVVDTDDKIIAHNHLSQLGKPFETLRNSQELHRFPLKDGVVRWGALIFYVSDNSLRHLWLQWISTLGGCVIAMTVAYGIRLGIEHHRLSVLRQALADQTAWGEEKQNVQQGLEQALADAQEKASAGFQSLLEKFPEPLLLLDARQRVVAFNSGAGQLLGLGQKENWIHASWQDVPWLQDQGAALERSLQTPNEEVLAEDNRYEGTLQTQAAWTWVKPRPVLRACR